MSNHNRSRLCGAARLMFEALCAKYNHRCLACGQEYGLSRDHVNPEGPDDITNWQPLCLACNASKSNKKTDYRKAPHPECALPKGYRLPSGYRIVREGKVHTPRRARVKTAPPRKRISAPDIVEVELWSDTGAVWHARRIN